jgi:hypothetical protein
MNRIAPTTKNTNNKRKKNERPKTSPVIFSQASSTLHTHKHSFGIYSMADINTIKRREYYVDCSLIGGKQIWRLTHFHRFSYIFNCVVLDLGAIKKENNDPEN